MEEDKRLEIFYDHYKDTFNYINNYQKNRNKLFLIVYLLFALLFFLFSNPNETYEIIIDLIRSRGTGKDSSISLNIGFINSILLLGLSVSVIKYLQVTLLINNQYKYIHDLEEKLNKELKIEIINREGKFYKSKRSLFSYFTGFFYTLLLPILLIILLGFKWYLEFKSLYLSLTRFIFDSFIIFISILSILLFISWNNFKDFSNKKNKIE